jgi:hypothetical protein
VFVRTDLSLAQQSVQSCHAAIECANLFNLKSLHDHPSVIILAAKNLSKLQQAGSFLKGHHVEYVEFREPDMDHELTAIATEPIYDKDRGLFKKFQLLRPKGGAS